MGNSKYLETQEKLVRIRNEDMLKVIEDFAEKYDIPLQSAFEIWCNAVVERYGATMSNIPF